MELQLYLSPLNVKLADYLSIQDYVQNGGQMLWNKRLLKAK